MAPTILFYGTNETQEFWESADHELILLRLLREDCWTAHRNYGYLFTTTTAEEAAHRLRVELSESHVWAPSRGKFALVPASLGKRPRSKQPLQLALI
jgi:hypothetical protein